MLKMHKIVVATAVLATLLIGGCSRSGAQAGSPTAPAAQVAAVSPTGPCSGPDVEDAFRAAVGKAVQDHSNLPLAKGDELNVQVTEVTLSDSVAQGSAPGSSATSCTTKLSAAGDLQLGGTGNLYLWKASGEAPLWRGGVDATEPSVVLDPAVVAARDQCKAKQAKATFSLGCWLRVAVSDVHHVGKTPFAYDFDQVHYTVASTDQGGRSITVDDNLMVNDYDLAKAALGPSTGTSTACDVYNDYNEVEIPVACPAGAEALVRKAN